MDDLLKTRIERLTIRHRAKLLKYLSGGLSMAEVDAIKTAFNWLKEDILKSICQFEEGKTEEWSIKKEDILNGKTQSNIN